MSILPPFKYPLDGVRWEKVTLYHTLQPGDHVVFDDGEQRHAIVEEVPGKQVVSLILWLLDGFLILDGEIVRRDYTLELGCGIQLKRAEYTQGCYDNDLVVKRAQARVGETDYDRFTNFARGFPEWCKTGRGRWTYDDTEADNRYAWAEAKRNG